MSAKKYGSQELCTELERVKQIIGRPPTRKDIESLSTISPDTFERNFGRWEQESMFDQLGLDHPSKWSIDNLSPEDGGWIAGFFCGEGCFRLKFLHKTRSTLSIAIAITVRDDDRELLEFIRKCWQLDEKVMIFSNEKRRLKGEHCGDEAKLHVYKTETLYYKILPTFTRFPLQGKKGREFEIFKKGIQILHNKRQAGRRAIAYTKDEIDELTSLVLELNEVRQHPIFKSSKANR